MIPDSIKGTSVLDLPAGQSRGLMPRPRSRPSRRRTSSSRPISARATIPRALRHRSCATCWRTRPGTPPTPRINPRFPGPPRSAAQLPDPDQRPQRLAGYGQRLACSARSRPLLPKPCLLQTPVARTRLPSLPLFPVTATRRPSTCCAPRAQPLGIESKSVTKEPRRCQPLLARCSVPGQQ